MATKAKQSSLIEMVPNGTTTSRSCVSDASDTSVSNLNAALLQSLDAASEKDLNEKYVSLKKRYPGHLLIWELDHHYLVLNEDTNCLLNLGLTAQVADCIVFEECNLYALLGDLMNAGKKAAIVSPLYA